MKKNKGIIAAIITLLVLTTALSSCKGSFIDPGTLEYLDGGGTGLGLGGDGGGGFGGGGGGGGGTAAPRNVKASAQSSNSIRITWDRPSSGGTPDGYVIYRSSSATGTYSYIDVSISTSYTDTGLNASTTYYYKVSAVYLDPYKESSLSSYASATTQSGSGGLPKLTGTVTITGNTVVGQTLGVNTSSLGGTGTISYEWFKFYEEEQDYLDIGTGSTYTIKQDDIGCYIFVFVTRSGNSGEVFDYVGPVTGSGGGTNPFAGTTWTGQDWYGDDCVMTFTADTWILSYPDYPDFDDGGTYTYNGNTATLTIVYDGDTYNVGTATISGNTLNVVIWDEEFTLTKQ